MLDSTACQIQDERSLIQKHESNNVEMRKNEFIKINNKVVIIDTYEQIKERYYDDEISRMNFLSG